MLGRYELVAPIGRGGMAEVHLAVQRGPADFEKLVVIKVVHEHLASQPAFTGMLLDEARHAGMIRHPNVVEIYELGEEAGRHFIVMEYLEGEPLLDVLRLAGEGGARLDPLSAARVLADTAEGLDAAHRLRSPGGQPIELVHHDVSLGNIVVLYSGLVKLVDFGVAKAQRASRGERVQGKLAYMAPEKVQDRAVDRRSDIWSLGCVLWEALTLQRLFKGDSDADTVRQVVGAEIPRPSEIDPDAPPELDPIVLRALERDPDRRYQTAKAMAADLEEALRRLGYGARNDRIAQHMEAAFAARIAARARVLMEVSSRRRPSPATLEAAFGEAHAPAASTITSTGESPIAPARADASRDGRQLSPSAFAQPRPRQTGTTGTPHVFSVASLLDDPDASAEPIRPGDPLLLRDLPPATPPAAPPAAEPETPPAATAAEFETPP
ncbi:MAG TPA: serine/threonine-protein kinase, partial [Kofleriaceae bacterium]|nr:serine/threonine-protein kinase [Kofleriaceae bacterium]